nr:CBL-interacting serine/threonine-protein kinase 1 isoform X1 [Tanacetum cinerariifolium]
MVVAMLLLIGNKGKCLQSNTFLQISRNNKHDDELFVIVTGYLPFDDTNLAVLYEKGDAQVAKRVNAILEKENGPGLFWTYVKDCSGIWYNGACNRGLADILKGEDGESSKDFRERAYRVTWLHAILTGKM